MKTANKIMMFALILIPAVTMLGACGGAGKAGNQNAATTASVSASVLGLSTDVCLDEKYVSKVIGFEVKTFPLGTRAAGNFVTCAYQSTNEALGGYISIMIRPASDAKQLFEELKSDAIKQSVEAINVGEGGYSYNSIGSDEAVAVARGRVYYVAASSTTATDLGDKKNAVIEILKKLIE